MITAFVVVLSSCQWFHHGPTIPEFTLQSVDSTTIIDTKNIPKGKPIIFVYFSPDCEHCQKQTEEWIAHSDFIRSARFYFVSLDSLSRIRLFNDIYKIYKYPNIVLAKDNTYSFFNIYKPSGTPYLIVYDKEKMLRYVMPGGAKLDSLEYRISQM